MKLRIRKLLAAALVICLVAAMLPGAALAADSGPFKVGNESYDTLSAAVARASGVSSRTVILDSAATLSTTSSIPSGVTLQMGSGASLAIESGVTLTNDGTITNSGNISVAGTFNSTGKFTNSGDVTVSAGAKCTISGTFTHNGDIMVAPGVAPSNGGALTISAGYTGNGGITVGARGTANLPDNQSVSDLTVNGTVSSSALTVTGTGVTVNAGGTLDVNALTVQGTLTNSGTIEGDSVSVHGQGALTHNATANTNGLAVDAIDVYGELEVKGNYTQGTGITVQSGGTMSVSGTYSMSGTGAENSLAVNNGGALNITGGKFTATNSLTVNGTMDISGGAEVSVGSVPAGTVKVESSTLKVGGSEFIGPNSLSGSVELTDSGKTITVESGTVNGSRGSDAAYTVASGEKLVVEKNLTVSYPLKIAGELEVNGTITSNDTLTIANSAEVKGGGRINTNSALYNLNGKKADEVSIYIGQNGGVYANNNTIDANVKNGTSSSKPAPDKNNYAYSQVYSQGASYGITVQVDGGHGQATAAQSGVEGQRITFHANPDEGYEVDPDKTYYVTGTVSDGLVAVSGDECSFEMPADDVTVHVGFRKAENSSTTTEGNITVTTNHNGNGNVNASINGRRVTVTARANSNYVIKSVSIANQAMSVSGTPQNGTWYYDVPGTGNATVSVYVTFEASARTVTVTNSSSRDGDVYLGTSGYTTTGQYKEGDRVYLRAVPDSSSFELRKLVIRNASNNTEIAYYPYSTYDDVYYFTMPDANVTVYGDFSDGLFEITTDIDGRGTLTIRGEDGETTDIAEEGEEVRIYASPSTGYRLGDIYVTYTDADKDIQTIYPEAEYNSRGVLQYYWFDMPEYDVEVYADFGEGDYVAYIDRSELKYGSVRVSPNVADEDDLVSVYITAETGYQLDKLVVEDEDGRSVSTNTIANGVRYTFNMPDSDVTVTATFKSKSYSSNFIDVARGSWYYDAVSYVASEGLMTGTGTNTFSPDGMTSRAQIVTILWRLSGEPSALTGAFTDVPAGQYYSTAVAWASREGIVTGVGNNRFEPNTNITREQLAVMLYRYAQDCGYSTTSRANITGYYDYARVGSYARDALSWAVGAGLITGTTTTTLSPQNTANRAQVATILMRFCENVVE